MAPKRPYKRVPLILWNNLLGFVVRKEPLVLHVCLFDQVGPLVGVALLAAVRAAATPAAAFPFLFYVSIEIALARRETDLSASGHVV